MLINRLKKATRRQAGFYFLLHNVRAGVRQHTIHRSCARVRNETGRHVGGLWKRWHLLGVAVGCRQRSCEAWAKHEPKLSGCAGCKVPGSFPCPWLITGSCPVICWGWLSAAAWAAVKPGRSMSPS